MRSLTLLAFAVLLAVPSSAAAETFTVTGTADVTGSCEGSSCPSIRAALATTQESPGADEILVPAGAYQLTQGSLTVDNPVTIRGAGARLTTIIGDPQLLDRVFDVGAVTATFTRLTMQSGTAGSHNGFFGGNLRNSGGDVLLDHVRVTDGSASSGGGVSNSEGTMTIQYSLIDGNRADTGGADSGGVQNFGASVPGVLTIRDSTVAFNHAELAGGVFSWGDAANVTTLERVTIAHNTGGGRGVGGISADPNDSFHVRASIIAHNTVGGAPWNCDPGPITDGGNVVSNGDCEFAGPGDLENADPLLSTELTNVGGETDVLTLSAGSPAQDRAGGCLGADQRDLPRPQGGVCDAGAFEIDQAPDTSLAMTPGSGGTSPTFTFSSTEPGVRFECRLDGPGGAGAFAPCASPATYSGLAPGAYTFVVRAVDGGGAPDPTPASAGFTIPVPQRSQLPPPEPGENVNALPKSGTVRIKLPGDKAFTTLAEGEQIPLGTTIDTLKGRVTLVAASDKKGGTATADFYQGVFKVLQTKGAKPTTRLLLTEKLSCAKGQATAAAKRKKKRKLWGDGNGKFRTEGEFSSATVRGTKWLVEDRCASTLTRVVRGKVAVRDFEKKKTVIVRRGKRYIARAS